MIDINIKNGLGDSNRAEVTSSNAVKVANIEYNNYSPAARFFQNPIYGVDMNKNWSNEAAGNANELIHDGTDVAAWTASAILGGTWDFADTNNPDTGTKNISNTASVVGQTAQFDRGSSVTMVNHTGFQGRLYITTKGHINAQIDFYAWDTGTGTQVGTSVDLYDYVNDTLLLTYQTFSVPLTDMGLTGATFDSVRVQITTKSGAIFDMDNIYLTDPTGSSAIGTTTFTMAPERGGVLYLDGFIVNMADAYSGTVSDGTMPSLRYDGFLGEPALSAAMIYRVLDGENTVFTAAFSQLIDFMQFGSPEIRASGSDGSNSWMTIYIGLKAPIELFDDVKQKVTLTLSADLSGLLFFRFSADCRILN